MAAAMVTPGDLAKAEVWEARARRAIEADPSICDPSSETYDRDLALVDSPLAVNLRTPYETLIRSGEIPPTTEFGDWLDSADLDELRAEFLSDAEDEATSFV